MANEWILDVLADLKAFAGTNGLPRLAAQLADTELMAATEIASSDYGAPIVAAGDAGRTGGIYRAHQGRRVAG